jgi:hypothetical protein
MDEKMLKRAEWAKKWSAQHFRTVDALHDGNGSEMLAVRRQESTGEYQLSTLRLRGHGVEEPYFSASNDRMPLSEMEAKEALQAIATLNRISGTF